MAAVARPPPPAEQSYTFAAQPRPQQAARQRYRDAPANEERAAANIMFDPRVVRGSTYAATILPVNAAPDPLELQRQAESRRRRRLKKQQQQASAPPRTPQPVEGRQHREIQTELYLDEIKDRPLEVDAVVQTDQLLDRPPTPVYVPQKTGIDAETQVYEGDLFDFDFEVEPILEVITGKTLEQALMEVMEEEELANMRQHQIEFQFRRDAELAETQRMEEAERRKFEEKERRLQQERDRVLREAEARQKVAARAYAQHYCSDIIGHVFGSLKKTGYFYDTVERDVETGFLPFLMDRVAENITKRKVARDITDSLVALSLTKRETRYQEHLVFMEAEARRREEEEREQAAAAAEAARLAAEQAAAAEAEAKAAEEADTEEEDEYSGTE